MEAQPQQSQLKSLAENWHKKSQMDCKDIIDGLSQEERNAILDALVELVIKGTKSEKNTRSLTICLRFFPQEEVFDFIERIKTGELLQQFCSFFDEDPEFRFYIQPHIAIY